MTVGTAHTFQGDERDVMLLSFCADPTSHRSTVTFLNNENLFNVAVTRARRRQVIYHRAGPAQPASRPSPGRVLELCRATVWKLSSRKTCRTPAPPSSAR